MNGNQYNSIELIAKSMINISNNFTKIYQTLDKINNNLSNIDSKLTNIVYLDRLENISNCMIDSDTNWTLSNILNRIYNKL